MEATKIEPKGNLTQDKIDKLDNKFKQLKKYHTLDAENGWKLESDKKGLKVYTRDDAETGCKWVRGETIVDTVPQDIIDRVLFSETKEAKYDTTTEESKALENINGIYFHYSLGKKSSMFVAARDTITMTRVIKEGDIIFCIGTSVDHPDMPERSGIVRADIIIWGYVLTPLAEDPTKTNMVYILGTDAKGSVPKTVVNWFISEQAEGVARIRDWIAANPKKN